jgi:8-hydroxy-5-deazaflavin:NADPH oxidoreductase
MKIGIIGDGNVGSALQRGLTKAGHDVKAVGNDPAAIRETARNAEIVILAVPYGAIDDVVRDVAGEVDNKVVIDVTNALKPDFSLAVGLTTSGAEELQKKLPGSRVVKAFNTVFAQHMDSGRVKDEQLTVLAAGDDADAKKVVIDLAKGIGFDAVDAGPLQSARLMEPLALLNISLGYMFGLGMDIGFRLVR